MEGAILYINNEYLCNWEEFKRLIILSFTSLSDRFKDVRQEILSSVRDGIAYDWAVLHNNLFSNELKPDNFVGMTDGELQKFLLILCGVESKEVNRPTFNNHLEIISDYKVIEDDIQNSYSIKTPIPISKSKNRKFQIGLKVVNPVNDRITITLVKNKKSTISLLPQIKSLFSDEISVDLKVKGIIHYVTIDISELRSCDAVYLYADGKLIYTFNSLPEYIDLGIGIKWATCNLGAEYPSESGEYFAWGESKPRNSFEDDYTYCRLSNISGIKPYDAATVTRGQNWRIPKRKEWNTLYSKCDVADVVIDGIPCLKFTSRINNKYIILPISGYMIGTRLCYVGSSDCYWSSIQDDANDAFDNTGSYKHKYYGLMIRPVYDESTT